jgi:hypothetical protein
MLEEVQVAPSALAGVMDLAAGNIAFGASEPGAPLEIDAQLKPTLTGIEGGLDHPPRRRQPQSGLEQLGISHRATVRDAKNQLPTQNGEEPESRSAPRVRETTAGRTSCMECHEEGLPAGH